MPEKTNKKEKIPLKKQEIVDAAFGLFKKNGFYATGVDLIMQTAGVSKRTLYKYFPSKNDLIAAVLDHYRAGYEVYLNQILLQPDLTSLEKILAIFEDATGWFEDSQFHGCLAVNAMGEFSGKDATIEQACIQFKRWEIDTLKSLTKDLDAHQPDELAYKLFVLLEGMSSIAQVTKGHCPIDMSELAQEIIAKHTVK